MPDQGARGACPQGASLGVPVGSVSRSNMAEAGPGVHTLSSGNSRWAVTGQQRAGPSGTCSWPKMMVEVNQHLWGHLLLSDADTRGFLKGCILFCVQAALFIIMAADTLAARSGSSGSTLLMALHVRAPELPPVKTEEQTSPPQSPLPCQGTRGFGLRTLWAEQVLSCPPPWAPPRDALSRPRSSEGSALLL